MEATQATTEGACCLAPSHHSAAGAVVRRCARMHRPLRLSEGGLQVGVEALQAGVAGRQLELTMGVQWEAQAAHHSDLSPWTDPCADAAARAARSSTASSSGGGASRSHPAPPGPALVDL